MPQPAAERRKTVAMPDPGKPYRTPQRPRESDDLRRLPTFTHLVDCWEQAWSARSTPACADLNPLLHDPLRGLGLHARVLCLRSVFRHMLRIDFKRQGWTMPKTDGADQLCLASGEHAKQLFTPGAMQVGKRANPVIADSTLTAIADPLWRQRLCDIHECDCGKVYGLNEWFGDRYTTNLDTRAMTPELLFDAPFFGRNAPANYVHFLLTGLRVPDANRSLCPHEPFGLPNDPLGRARDDLIGELATQLATRPNQGRPIVTVSCPGSSEVASRIACSLVDRLQRKRVRSVCYLPVRKGAEVGSCGDHGFRAIVEALWRFVAGHDDLTPRLSRSWSERDVAEAITAIRLHFTRVATVVVLDGFIGDSGELPATIDFIRDEPVNRLLRLLQHPDFGQGHDPASLRAFRRSYFVVVGEPSPSWLAMHRNETLELPLLAADIDEMLARYPLGPGAAWAPRARATWARGSDHVQAFCALMTHRAEPSAACTASERPDTLEAAFEAFMEGLLPWQATLLQGLALSETGLRVSTLYHLLSAYERCAKSEPDSVAFSHVTYPQLSQFVQTLREPKGASIVVAYAEGSDASVADAFAMPAQGLQRLDDWHPWVSAARKGEGHASLTLDIGNPCLRHLLRQSLRPHKERLLRRILAELALQAYRIRIRHSDPQRRVGRRAARNIVEALYHGFRSIDFASPQFDDDPVLDKLTLGEIPQRPVEAFSFLYFTVYRSLLCGGSIWSLGRVHGNGALELELLLFTANPGVDATRLGQRFDSSAAMKPAWAEWPIPTAGPRPFRQAAVGHLFALARCSRRATRIELFEDVLEQLDAMEAEAEGLSVEERLTLCKFSIDLSMRKHSSKVGGRAHAWWVWKRTRLVLEEALFPGTGDAERARLSREVMRAFWGLRREVAQAVRDSLGHGIPQAAGIDPTQIEKAVEQCFKSVLTLTTLPRINHDVIAILTRLAILQGNVARTRRKGLDIRKAVTLHLQTVAMYWLIRRIASRRARANPLLTRSRLGADNAQEYVACVVNLRSLLLESSPEIHAVLIERLDKSMRQTLDTFTREQGVDKADHVLSQILESNFTRNITATTPSVMRQAAAARLGIDDLLQPLWLCYRWLHQAEKEMLSFSSRPTLRVSLCIDRINCSLEYLRRAYGKDTRRVRTTSTVRATSVQVLEWLENDLHQLDAFDAFMKDYSPRARFLRKAWQTVLADKCEQVRAAIPRDVEATPEWNVACAGLDGVATRLMARHRPAKQH